MELLDNNDSNNSNMKKNSNQLAKYKINTETTAVIGLVR